MPVDPQKAADIATVWAECIGGGLGLLGSCWAVLKYLLVTKAFAYNTFPTKTHTEETYLKKSEPDGTRLYVHVSELATINSKLDQVIQKTDQWQNIAEKWIKNP